MVSGQSVNPIAGLVPCGALVAISETGPHRHRCGLAGCARCRKRELRRRVAGVFGDVPVVMLTFTPPERLRSLAEVKSWRTRVRKAVKESFSRALGMYEGVSKPSEGTWEDASERAGMPVFVQHAHYHVLVLRSEYVARFGARRDYKPFLSWCGSHGFGRSNVLKVKAGSAYAAKAYCSKADAKGAGLSPVDAWRQAVAVQCGGSRLSWSVGGGAHGRGEGTKPEVRTGNPGPRPVDVRQVLQRVDRWVLAPAPVPRRVLVALQGRTVIVQAGRAERLAERWYSGGFSHAEVLEAECPLAFFTPGESSHWWYSGGGLSD